MSAGPRLRAWCAFFLAVLFIAFTLEPAFAVSSFLRARGYLWPTVQVLFVAAAAAIAWLLWFGARIRGARSWLLAAPALAAYLYAMITMRSNPAERLHFLEYGILYLLALRAVAIDARGPLAYAIACIATALAGWFDEGMQHFAPTRYFDWGDVTMNAVAAALAAVICFAFFGRDPALARFPLLPAPRAE